MYYNKILDFWWYHELKRKLDLLEENKIKINIMELNKYLYERMLYERGDIKTFNDTKYNIENFIYENPVFFNNYEITYNIIGEKPPMTDYKK